MPSKMECQACGYKNPRDTERCIECGAGLRWTARQRAEERFRSELETVRGAADERLKRAGVKRRGRRG